MKKLSELAAKNIYEKVASSPRGLLGSALGWAGIGTAAVMGSKDKNRSKEDRKGYGKAMVAGAAGLGAGTVANLTTTSAGRELIKQLPRNIRGSALGITGSIALSSGALLGAGAYALGKGLTSKKEKREKVAAEQPGYFERQQIGMKVMADNDGSIIRNKEDRNRILKRNLENMGKGIGYGALVGAGATTAATAIAKNAPLTRKILGIGTAVGAATGATVGNIKSVIQTAKEDTKKMRDKGFEYSALTGVKKVPEKYLK